MVTGTLLTQSLLVGSHYHWCTIVGDPACSFPGYVQQDV